MSLSVLLSFAAVSLAVIVVPGPSVLFAVSRAIAAGRRSALLTVLGNASGLFVQVILITVGLGVIVTRSDLAYDVLRTVGATYLIWLGAEAIRHRHDAVRAVDEHVPRPTATPWRDGFVVGVSNPKSLVFLAALLPKHVDLDAGPVAGQMLVLGALFCLIAIASDGAWAVLAARARMWFGRDQRRLPWASVTGGLVMIALGLLLLVG